MKSSHLDLPIKIDNLNNVYTQIMTDYNGNNDKIKSYLKQATGNQNGNLENLIENYINTKLLPNGDSSMNAAKTLVLMNNLQAKIISYEPNNDGIADDSQKSADTLDTEFNKIYYKDYSFKINIKEEPSFYVEDPVEEVIET